MALASRPPWQLDPDSEDSRCAGCSHTSIEHVPVFDSDDLMSYPCEADERFDIGPDGKMVLLDEPCPCEGFEYPEVDE